MKRALFLDRDGTIIEDHGYMRDPALVTLLPGAAESLKALSDAGWILIVISNQSGVGRGLITAAEMEAVQARFLEVMNQAGVKITASYFCTHRPDENCGCRKPSPFHLEEAAREYGLDLKQSWMIGDRPSDMACGSNAGCRTIWLENQTYPVVDGLADHIATDWSAMRDFVSA